MKKKFVSVEESVVSFFKSNAFKRFCWTTVNGFIAVVILQLTDTSLVYAPIVIGVLNNVTKWINQTYLS